MIKFLCSSFPAFSFLQFEFTFIHIKIYPSWFFFSFWISVGRKPSLCVYAWKYLYFALSHEASSWSWSCVDKFHEHIGSFILALSLESGNSHLRAWLEANWAIFFLLYPVGPNLASTAWLLTQGTETIRFFVSWFIFIVW